MWLSIYGPRAWWLGLTASMKSIEIPQGKTRTRKGTKEEEALRVDLVARIRREIAAGKYDSPERWDVALNRLLDHMDNA